MSLSFLVLYFLPSHALISHKLGGIEIKLKSYEKIRDQIKRKKILNVWQNWNGIKELGAKKLATSWIKFEIKLKSYKKIKDQIKKILACEGVAEVEMT
jgi:hypothetical protein